MDINRWSTLAYRVCVVGFVLLSAWPQAISAQTQIPTNVPPPGYIEINGRKNPADVPDHVAWRTAFWSIYDLERNGVIHLLEGQLPLPAGEKALVLEVARKQQDAEATCEKRQRAMAAMLEKQGETQDKVYAALTRIVMECRQQVLDAQEQLLAALSFETQLALRAWVDTKRGEVIVLVPRAELEEFRKPR